MDSISTDRRIQGNKRKRAYEKRHLLPDPEPDPQLIISKQKVGAGSGS